MRNVYRLIFCFSLLSPRFALAADPSPGQEVKQFYVWYITQNDNVGTQGNNTLPLQQNDILRYVSRDLRNRLLKAYRQGTYADLAQGADYFYHAQDTGENWSSEVQTRTVSIAGNRALVSATLGNKESFRVLLCVRVEREKDGWRIYQVDSHDIPDPPPGCRSS